MDTTTHDTSLEVDALPAGQYFLKVQSTDGTVKEDAYEYYHTEAGTTVYSVLCFYVHEDGTTEPVIYSEDE